MKSASAVLVLALLTPCALALGESPVSKALELLTSLSEKITTQGETAEKEYAEFAEYCKTTEKQLEFDITTGEKEVADLSASIEQSSAMMSSLSTKIEELAASISADEADMKAAEEIRSKESADFAATEAELREVIDTLERAVGLLRKQGTSMPQSSVGGFVQALDAMVQASVFSSADAKRLTALLQSSQEPEDDGEESFGAPAAAVYTSHSGSIIDTLEDLSEKAEAELSDARKQETTALHNFEMLKQSLSDQIKFDTKDMAEAKKGLEEATGKKASAEGELAETSKALAEDKTAKADLEQDCMTKAQDFEAAKKSRAEELAALAEAKRIISESTGGSEALTYGLNQLSFVQLSSRVDLANFEAVRFVRDLARKQNSQALAQLASKMSSAMHVSSSTGEDPFAKVKGLISGMIEKLEGEASADASHKAFCDEELSGSTAKKEELDGSIEKLSTKIDQMTASSAQLKEEITETQKALSELIASQAEMDKMRATEKETFVSNKADMEQGLEGVKLALKVLREYYAKAAKAHEAEGGASTGIIGTLEVVESDFSKGLAEMIAIEESAASSYDTESKENAIEKVTKEQDVTYKTKESASLDKAVADLSSDREGVQTELDAVLEYLEKLKEQCVAKPEAYADRKQRREAEISGLKEALNILEGEAVLLQSSSRRTFLGARHHISALSKAPDVAVRVWCPAVAEARDSVRLAEPTLEQQQHQ
eukprot:CAMPEP_0170579020 /NCGR_PEP_ID=MMETSP0224-20130122/5765_1 /TAXON_ID=285029 /ORGANISM="Togula jolla, Strain CCCM 725" /LENGTH=716 /DNA_ID=CAMNT_0010902025 /DNA_START=46 /DNA_END=2192 /DNA_ORIENTATION=+